MATAAAWGLSGVLPHFSEQFMEPQKENIPLLYAAAAHTLQKPPSKVQK